MENNKEGEFVLTVDDMPEPILKMSKGKFYAKGVEIDDVHQVYERFNEWLTLAEGGSSKE